MSENTDSPDCLHSCTYIVVYHVDHYQIKPHLAGFEMTSLLLLSYAQCPSSCILG